MPRGRMILRRLLWVFPVAFGVVTLTFFMARVFNGDPTELYAPPEATDALRAQIRARLGLADPLPVQYVKYLWDLLRFDLGTSFTTGQSVASDLWDRLPATLELGLIGLGLGIAVGIPLGVMAAVYRERWPDFLLRGVTLGGMALPQLTVGLRMASAIGRVTRSAMVEGMQSDYIRTAIAMGHGRRAVWFRYSLRNALLPVVTLIGGVAGHIFAGAVLLESIFAWPGLGQYALQAIERSDFAALQGFVIYASLLYVLAFLLVDLLYMFIDPRIRA